jgi:sialic acid synthase SpsE
MDCLRNGSVNMAMSPTPTKSFSGASELEEHMDFVSKQFSFKPGERCIVIGEIGVNHNRQEDMLFRLIDEGIAAGLDVIKLQRFKSEEEIATLRALHRLPDQKAGEGDGQLEMARKLELPDEWLVPRHLTIAARKRRGVPLHRL